MSDYDSGMRVPKGQPGKPGAVVHLRCVEPMSNGKPCGRPSVEHAPPFRCSGHLYLAEHPQAASASRRPARKPRALPVQRDTLF